LPVDVPRILRSRRVVGRGFLAATCMLALPIFVFTAALFLLFPRVGLSLLIFDQRRSGNIGFNPEIDLNDVGVMRANPDIALRFEVSGLPDPPPERLIVRFRGTARDTYNTRTWSRSTPEAKSERVDDTFNLSRYNRAGDRHFTIDVEPIDPPVIFIPQKSVFVWVRKPPPAALGEPFTLMKGPEGELRYGGGDARGLHYEVYTAPENERITEDLLPSERPRYLQRPPNFPSRIGQLAREWTADQPTPLLKAKAIEEHLKKDFRYDLTRPSGGKPEPIDDFLFNSKAGHCEFFSTAMAMMLREIGIPSRNVMGFLGGTYNHFGRYYAVRQGDAHSWVEAYIDENHAWMTFDPTPTSGAQPVVERAGAYVYIRDFLEAASQRWNRYVVGYDLSSQHTIFQNTIESYNGFRKKAHLDKGVAGKATRPSYMALAFVVLCIVAYSYWMRRRRNANDPTKPRGDSGDKDALRSEAVATLYRALEAAMATHGLTRPPSLPPLRHAEAIKAASHPIAEEVFSLTTDYIELRFGGKELTETLRREYERRVRAVRTRKLPPAEQAPAES
jgi:transglutaminase-like putative cysteine protease